MTGTVLERSLRNVIARLQKLRILRSQTACWLLLLVPAILVTLWLPGTMGYIGPELPVLFGATILGTILSRILTKKPSVNDAARLVEQTHPELNDAVLTAVQIAQHPGKRPSVLAAMAVQEADQLARQRDWSHAVSGGKLAKWTLLSFLSFVVMVSSVMAASRYGRDLIKPAQNAGATSQKEDALPITELVIEPGNIEIERGSALTVVAKFPAVVPTNAVLEFLDSQRNKRQLVMNETVDAGVFAARMEEITSDGTYRVIYYDAETRSDQPEESAEFSVTTYVRPKLQQVDAVVTPPAWAGRPQETIEDVMRMTVTEGSTVQLKLRLNKPVAIAALQPKDGPAIVLSPNAEDSSLFETTLVVMDSNAWIVQLEDSEGRTPKDEEQISIKVSRNQQPRIKVTFPGKDTNVSPLQEFLIEAMISDDFGITAFGVEYSLSGGELKDVALNKAPSDDSTLLLSTVLLNTTISHEIILEDLKAAPDDLVTYTFWANDIGPDGHERRSYSDIMFAEVRRFEEIFRESQQQQSQQQQQQQNQQQQGSAVDGVLKLQKEIISATWNTIRAEGEKRKDGSFTTDVGVISESQRQAIEQLETSMEEMADDPKLNALGDRAKEEMTAAYEKLEEVKAGKEEARLAEAMSIEQSIVQTLLKMRAAEFQIQQQQQGGGGGGGGGSASQQQMQQLELDNERNRYETEQQAQEQQEQSQQQREQVQVLNRLKELARRQQMVNERLKQLESELRAATTEKEKEEIERELKRLRDEQREMLRDVDELSERMEQAGSQQQSSEQKSAQQQQEQQEKQQQMQQQMEQARENVQQASRAMDAGNLAEAISEGTRAEREFEELKEDFRDQTSSQFDDAVRDLRDQARELSDEQKTLAQKLSGNDPEGEQTKQPSLRPDRNREQLQKDVAKQRDRLNQVVDQTKQMIEQAEETEPLLSNKLYDTLRDLKDTNADEALQATELLTSRGMWSQSQQAEQAARQGIEQLKEGIEKAADAVLGSEVESLRRAQSQLQDATDKLANEVQNATGEKPGERGGVSPPVQNQTPHKNQQPGQGQQQNAGGQNGSSTQQSSSLLGGGREGNSPRGAANAARPLTGSNEFTEWSDQLRDIEEMLDDPDLRNRVAQVRDRAKAIRADFKRHGEQPQWDLVKSQLLGEMQSLQKRIAEELAKRDSDRAMVPIDREPVPEEFDSLVQKYYELLGRERDNQ